MKNDHGRVNFISAITRCVSIHGAVLLILAAAVCAQSTIFSLKATLPNDVTPATDTYQMEFKLFDAETGGSQVGSTNTIASVDVKGRSFTVWLDFGAAAFPGADRYIEISYRRNGNQPFKTVETRERILSVPYAIRALNATTADSVNGIDFNDFVLTTDPRLSDDRNPLPGSTHYIQNSTVQQPSSNFNISGNGRANIFNAVTQYDLGGLRILDGTGGGLGNLSVGIGTSNTGLANTFVGSSAGFSNTGSQNTFVGTISGLNNTSGRSNSFFGNASGSRNTTGNENAFFGFFSGNANTTGLDNTFFGSRSGFSNVNGNSNTFLGARAGESNSTGEGNTYVGSAAGSNGVSGDNNTLVGANTNVNSGVFDSTAVGANIVITKSHTNILGTSSQVTKLSGGIANTFGTASTFGGLIADNLVFRRLGVDIAASSSPLCFRIVSVANQAGESDAGNGLTSCLSSSASEALKTDIKDLTDGVEVIRQLRPVSFKWKAGGTGGIGLNAEDVAKVAPSLVKRDVDGKLLDVNAEAVNILLINSVRQQQLQIDAQQKQIEALKKLVCATNPLADVCKD